MLIYVDSTTQFKRVWFDKNQSCQWVYHCLGCMKRCKSEQPLKTKQVFEDFSWGNLKQYLPRPQDAQSQMPSIFCTACKMTCSLCK